MVAALALLAIATGLGTVAALWPIAGWWSLAAAPFAASLATAVVAFATARATADVVEEPVMSADEMVAALRSVLPERPEAPSQSGTRRAA